MVNAMPLSKQVRPLGLPDQDPETVGLVRRAVRDLLSKSEAFRALPPEQQREIAYHTVQLGSYLAQPEGIRGNTLPNAPDAGPLAQPMADTVTVSRERRKGTNKEGQFTAQAASEGARVAGALLQAVNFPQFVSGLITGVFHSIVTSSIEQMEAYGRLVADVAKTLNQFRDENVSVNQGKDHLVDQFPDLFSLEVDTGEEGGPAPRVRLRDGADESAALKRVNDTLPLDKPLTSLDDDAIEEQAVPAARTQLATSRQQLLATMVLMGINRIVVTEGKISAKVMYDFQARDNMKYQNSATRFDYGDQYKYTSEGESEVESERGERSYKRDKEGAVESSRGASSYYAKGQYKNTAEPVLSLISASQTSIDASLTTKASLAGVVEVNFKSDYLPLEKMADSFQIAQIQQAAKPGRPAAVPQGAAAAASQGGTAPASR
jgi:hypothetical protein